MPEVKGIKSRNSNKNYVNSHNARNSYATGVSGNLQTGKNHGCNNKKSREIIESASPTGLTGYNSADNPEIHQSHPQSPHGKPVLHVPPALPPPSLRPVTQILVIIFGTQISSFSTYFQRIVTYLMYSRVALDLFDQDLHEY